jgi:3'-phosphoadenosine 5'-phosphosulfate sulfotransferase (PAPS reductase)/FAD synthetase
LGVAIKSLNLPILKWSEKQVFDYLGDEVNPLYEAGFNRVGCFPCLANATKRQLNNAYNYDDFGRSQKLKVIELENITGVKHTASNTGQMCLMCTI